MSKISRHIVGEASELKINLIELSKNYTNILFEKIMVKYIEKPVGTFVWEKIVDNFSVCDGNAWKWINEFIQNKNTIMILLDEEASFIFQNGEDVVLLLAELYPFEFFLTDENLTYLLCYNHHDYLTASGIAKEWLKSRYKA
ncbi:MAG: hypothetical protein R3Y29_09120 [bacterium]